IGALLDMPGTADLASHGVRSILRSLRDTEHGGTFSDPTDPNAPKTAYLECFTALAASAALHAGVEGADELLNHSSATLLERFWSDVDGALVDEWDRAFTHASDYRGANANMHAVEAFNAIGVATGDIEWHHRASRIAELIVHRIAR